MLAHRHVRIVACGFGAGVNSKVFGSRNGAVVVWIIALQASNVGNAHAPGQEWVLPIRLLPAAPARIAEDVDVGRPEVEALKEHAGALFANGLHVLDATLHANSLGHFVNSGRIEARSQTDGLWELGDATVDDAVQSPLTTSRIGEC